MSTLEWRRGGVQGSGGSFRGGPARRATAARGGSRGRGGRPINNKSPVENGPKPVPEPISNQPSSTSEAPKPIEPISQPSEETEAPAAKPKAQAPRKGPRVNVPAINVQSLPKEAGTPSASPTTSTTSRPPNRRKRSQNNNKSTKSETTTPTRQTKPSHATPQNGTAITKDLPPHLAQPQKQTQQPVSIKPEIDALVERVRAGAMERPSTPGSHIDWADDDDSLPDLDDWMKPPSTGFNLGNQANSVISPLVMDGLKSLPDEKFQPKSSSLSTFSLFPPTTDKSDTPNNVEDVPTPSQPPSEPSAAVSATPPSKPTPEGQDDPDANKPGLGASMHAPKNDEHSTVSSSASLPTPFPNNDRLIRRPSPAHHHRLSRSGASTPSERARGRHARNHSTPPVTHRVPATRPVITGDAISRLARTIGGMKAKE